MYTRRAFLAFALAASTTSGAFAELTEASDRISELTQTLELASGSYLGEDDNPDMDIPGHAQMTVKLRDSSAQPVTTVFNNKTIEEKYGASLSNSQSYKVAKVNNLSSVTGHSWLVSHPLPSGRVSSNYGGRVMNGRAENHSGLDLAAPTGTPIYATGPGIVTKSGWGTGYGQYVEINHGNGYITRYAHASRLIARVGDRVAAGDHIANVGCTGRCTGPHLHYEVVKDGQRKNPSTYLALLP